MLKKSPTVENMRPGNCADKTRAKREDVTGKSRKLERKPKLLRCTNAPDVKVLGSQGSTDMPDGPRTESAGKRTHIDMRESKLTKPARRHSAARRSTCESALASTT